MFSARARLSKLERASATLVESDRNNKTLLCSPLHPPLQTATPPSSLPFSIVVSLKPTALQTSILVTVNGCPHTKQTQCKVLALGCKWLFLAALLRKLGLTFEDIFSPTDMTHTAPSLHCEDRFTALNLDSFSLCLPFCSSFAAAQPREMDKTCFNNLHMRK